MLGFNRRLAALEKEGGCIRVGLVGAGQMGRGLISQIEGMHGMRVVITADLFPENVKAAYRRAGVPDTRILETQDFDKADQAIASGYSVATTEAELIPQLSNVDVIVDATGMPDIGAKVAWEAIRHKKHIVMLNVEADVTVGPWLKKLADDAGVVYTGSAGDEPGAIMELHDFADALGFEIVALGKGKNNALNVHANPDTAREEAAAKGSSPKMLASFQDGTKTMVEMTAVANATGFVPDVPGMHGRKAQLAELPGLFSLTEAGGMLNRAKIVDYVDGVAPGVFAIISSSMQEVHDTMKYLKMGSGPNYVLYRPYHLTSLETPLSIARAYLQKEATIAPYFGMVAETVAVAKKDLRAGEALDGIGGFSAYGKIITAADRREQEALPIGLIGPNIRLSRDVAQGSVITFHDIEITEQNTIMRLREQMENND
ncbi:SAF domain-containing protein [Brevibacillus nitrificans]|uniref:NAD(P)H-dependent oxidoreductase n=1 Tax=Brevibacillus nitrificans TaxID=651560 RepID=UPI002865FC20|nr:SAF domain-containing protein [Brevibacillus nitrificans]MDR7316672.1 putative homoserine dehydrogenase-like protein [Brevibacillus nitrificans]